MGEKSGGFHVCVTFFFKKKSHLKNKDWDARAHCLDDNVFMDLLLLALQLNNREGQLSLLRGGEAESTANLGDYSQVCKTHFSLAKNFPVLPFNP